MLKSALPRISQILQSPMSNMISVSRDISHDSAADCLPPEVRDVGSMETRTADPSLSESRLKYCKSETEGKATLNNHHVFVRPPIMPICVAELCKERHVLSHRMTWLFPGKRKHSVLVRCCPLWVNVPLWVWPGVVRCCHQAVPSSDVTAGRFQTGFKLLLVFL